MAAVLVIACVLVMTAVASAVAVAAGARVGAAVGVASVAGGGLICARMSLLGTLCHSSVSWLPLTRQMSTIEKLTGLPVAATPNKVPLWVPLHVTTAVTKSPSITHRLMVVLTSGIPESVSARLPPCSP